MHRRDWNLSLENMCNPSCFALLLFTSYLVYAKEIYRIAKNRQEKYFFIVFPLKIC